MVVLDKNKYKSINNREDVVKLRNYIVNKFKDLVFIEESHQYFLNGVELTSVSNVCHRFQEKFDKDKQALNCFNKYFNDTNSKYYNMTVEDILKSWDDIAKAACDKGHINHSFGEDVFYLLTEQYDKIQRELVDGNLIPNDKEEENIIVFFNELPNNVIPILCETKVFNEGKRYSGTFDLLMAYDDGINKLSQNLIIYDYKTNVDLFKNFNNKKLLHPFEDLLDMSYSLYSIQLSLYQLPLEQIKCNVIGRRLVHIRGENYKVYKLNNLTKILDKNL
ncbi:MAG: hypothetical protein M0R03_20980 [Novosphingobium sp.]|nr:hypothetical protein [Novosphingobium sp.]